MVGVDGERLWKRAGAGAGIRRGAVAIFGALLWTMTGCGSNVVMPAWLNLDPSQSTMQISINGGPPEDPLPIEGGIYSVIHLDLTNPLLIQGTIDVPQVRIGTFIPLLGAICVSTDPDNPSQGSLTLNTLTGASSMTLPMHTLVWNHALGTVPAEANPTGLSFPLDTSLVTQVLDSGEIDGVIQEPITIDQSFDFFGTPAVATIHAVLTSSSVPPVPSAAVADCPAHWKDQVGPMAVVVNSKGTYLRTFWDNARGARVVSLAQIDAKPGDEIEFNTAGSFFNGVSNSSRIAAAFSATPTLSPNPGFFGNRNRLPDAIDAGLDVVTPRTLYFGLPTDISPDFELKPGTRVTVPAGAQYLFFTPIDSYFKDNSSLDLRVQIVVNPQS